MKPITKFTFFPLTQIGICFIEILFALIILTTGILAFAKLQIFAFQNTQDAFLRSVAISQIASLSDALSIERDDGLFISSWERSITQLIPQAAGTFIKTGNNTYMLISWKSIFKHDAISLEAFSRQI